jgi:peptidyl-tRNA hydrolase
VIVRDDLPRGTLAAQVVHAAGESARLTPRLPRGTHAVVLGATGARLLDLERALCAAGVPHAAIREPDSPYHGALLAIGVQPAPRASLKRHLGKLRLLGERARAGARAKHSATAADRAAHVEPPAAAVRRENDEDRREEGPD